ncbi:hypothetical protein [Luteimicrobium sp. DT211]|uniref:hypothetical protein n=1 Tax=Luteimicrobium sp. DT211 TaxID=3393412 RepID=UPI003CF418D7
MTTKTTIRTAAAALTIAAAYALTGCAGGPDDPTPAGTSASPAVAAPTTSPGAVAAPAVQASVDDDVAQLCATYWTADTTTDKTPQAAVRRAAALMTPRLREATDVDLPSGGGAAWTQLAAHRGRYITTTQGATDAMALPADTDTTASRGQIITLIPTGVDGWIGKRQVIVVQIDLTRADADSPWLVDHVDAQQPVTSLGDASPES